MNALSHSGKGMARTSAVHDHTCDFSSEGVGQVSPATRSIGRVGLQVMGNQELQHLFAQGAIQAKIAISQPNDPDEQEIKVKGSKTPKYLKYEIKDAYDRYANIEIAYLLQKMEECKGVVILAGNLAKNLGQTFSRRITTRSTFPNPMLHCGSGCGAACFHQLHHLAMTWISTSWSNNSRSQVAKSKRSLWMQFSWPAQEIR